MKLLSYLNPFGRRFFRLPLLTMNANDPTTIQELKISHDFQTIQYSTNYTEKHTIHPLLTHHIMKNALEKNIPVHFFSDSKVFPVIFMIGFYSFMIPWFVTWFRSIFHKYDQTPFSETTLQYTLSNSNTTASYPEWIGSPEVKQECLEVVDWIQWKTSSSDHSRELPFRVPKGLLFNGPPGTGKTLLAKIIATQSNARFISTSGSEFVEMYVGVGASRIRKLFQEARKQSPTILFIDEIDAIGKRRNEMNNNEEREQTLNQLLVEMDGFQTNHGLLVIAATNRVDILDNALLRPGRFDRIIHIPLPDFYSRIELLNYYLSKHNHTISSAEIETLSTFLEGFSGASIENIVNEALILLWKQKEETALSYHHMMTIVEKQWIGVSKSVEDRPYEIRKRIAIHELGHACMVYHYSSSFILDKVTIQNTYNGIGGYTLYRDRTDEAKHGLYTYHLLFQKIVILLGGRVAEDIYYGFQHTSLGATQDLHYANQLARQMITEYGWNTHHLLTAESEEYRAKFDKEVVSLLYEAYQNATSILVKEDIIFQQLMEVLLEKKTILLSDFEMFY